MAIHLSRRKLLLDIIGLAMMALSLLTVLALASYRHSDPSFNTHVAPDHAIANWVGPFGSYWADLLIQGFGLASFVLVVVLGLLAICLFLAKSPSRPVLLAIGGVLLMSGICSLLNQWVQALEYRGHSVMAGGVWGLWVESELAKVAGPAGSAILSLTALLMGALFIFQFTMDRLLGWSGYTSANLANRLGQRWTVWREHRRRLAEQKAEQKASLVADRRPIAGAASIAGTDGNAEGADGTFDLGDRLRAKFSIEEAAAAPVRTARSRTQKTGTAAPDAKTPARSIPKVHTDLGGIVIEERESAPTAAAIEGALRREPRRSFQLPPLGLLNDFTVEHAEIDKEFLIEQARRLEEKFSDFSIGGQVTNVKPGPVITLFEFKPAPGVKISRIANLSDDLALALSALSVRIIAPIPGKDVVGIEIPNAVRETVWFKEMLATVGRQEQPDNLPIMLGKDTAGLPVMTHLVKAPHLLVAGATGAGKSVFVNALISSLLFECTPDQVRFIMVDPKMLELSVYNGIPHLLCPVITDPRKAVQAMAWAVAEMERRYRFMTEIEVRNLRGFNEKVTRSPVLQPSLVEAGLDPEPLEPMPSIVIIIDEFADLMVVASKELETLIMRLAQKARAAGIHLVLATQRPSVNVITGVIKANLPSRIAFKVTGKVDSRTILDANGAEYLLGNGDMLYLGATAGRTQRLHGAYISEEEVKRVVDFLKAQGEAQYDPAVLAAVERPPSENPPSEAALGEEDDGMYAQAVQIVLESGKASISYVQRRLKIGYNRAARLIERMESEGIITGAEAGKPREILGAGPKESDAPGY